MIRFFEEYMGSYNPFEDRGCDEQRILRNSLYAVLPKIVKNELTQKQRLCFEMFYIDKKNQKRNCKYFTLITAYCEQAYQKCRSYY